MRKARTVGPHNTEGTPPGAAGTRGGFREHMAEDARAETPVDYPARFIRAVERVLTEEGGYVRNPSDPGGETRYGISRREYPRLDLRSLTREQAIAIYYRDFWRKQNYAELPAPLGEKLFDLAVNMGPAEAVRCIQRALRACSHRVDEDGVLGPVTVAAARSVAPGALNSALRSEAAAYYRLTAARWRGECEFLAGWLNRAYE